MAQIFVSAVAHFFVVVGGSKIHERLAHFFIDIYTDSENMYNYSSNDPIATFVQSDFANGEITKYFGMHLMDNIGKAGDYGGVMEYSFECSPIED